jgi:molecular chaperone GrpE
MKDAFGRANTDARMQEAAMSDVTDDAAAPTGDALDAAALATENAALRDRSLRALADAENARKQAERTTRDARLYAISDFARELLPVADNLQRTLASAEQQAPQTVEDAALIEGVRATFRILLQTLERFGISRIDALGVRFDPKLHDAIMEVEDPSHPPGTVVRVLEDGYTIHDRLLRPARVVVTRRGPNSSTASDVQAPDIVPQDSPPNKRK